MLDYEIEDFEIKEENGLKQIILPKLTKEEKGIIDPIVAPTSGLRIQLLDKINQEKEGKYLLTKRKLMLFLRIFKAISLQYKKTKNSKDLRVLIVTDDRPTRNILLKYSSQIFAQDGFEIYYQSDEHDESRVSSPYGAASVALLENINLIIVLTASHNDLTWNGIKFYIDYPIPMSGDLFKKISSIALNLEEIYLKTDFKIQRIDAEEENNNYVKRLLSEVIEIKSIKDKNIVLWPYLGEARGISKLFRDYGANIIRVEEGINPPNPIKILREKKLQEIMNENQSDLALLLDADRDRIALYARNNHSNNFLYFIPNEIYSAMHNILADKYSKKILNVRTIPSDPRSDEKSYLNILTGVGYKHLGIILYFLLGVKVEKSKVDSAILYLETQEKELIKIDNPSDLNHKINQFLLKNGLIDSKFIIVMWEESGGHTLNIISCERDEKRNFKFNTHFPIIADKYPVPALVIITELILRGHIIPESINWTIKGINRTIPATDEEKIKIMTNFEENDGGKIEIGGKTYNVKALSDNKGNIDIYQLKSNDSTLYFRPSGTGPEVRFYIFGKRETHLEEIKTVQEFVKSNYS